MIESKEKCTAENIALHYPITLCQAERLIALSCGDKQALEASLKMIICGHGFEETVSMIEIGAIKI